LPSEYLDEYENISEWADGSGLREKKITIEYLKREEQEDGEIEEIIVEKEANFEDYEVGFEIRGVLRKGVLLYNAGDIPIKPKIVCKIPESSDFVQKRDIKLRLYSFYNGSIRANKTEDFVQIGEITISKDLVAKCK
jgi:hypothetical protein